MTAEVKSLAANPKEAWEGLYNEGRARFAAATTDEEYSSIHGDLMKRIDAVEEAQGVGGGANSRKADRPSDS